MKTTTFETDKVLTTIVHFNRVAMQRGSEYVWTVHNSLGCFNVTKVVMRVPMFTIFDKDGRQPRAKFKGKARISIKDSVAYLHS